MKFDVLTLFPDMINQACSHSIVARGIQSGIIYGSASQVDGMIERIKEEVGNPNINVYATGGLSKMIIPLCKNEIRILENLTLYGLLRIYLLNKGN